MKCLSLWQPWAHLIAIGAKRIETRSWKPPIQRGCSLRIAIHAAKTWNRELEALCFTPPFVKELRQNEGAANAQMVDRLRREMGHVIAVAYVAGWDHTENLTTKPDGDVRLSPREKAFGDYRHGRFAWYLHDVRALEMPIPCTGRQGLFEIPEIKVPELGHG